MVKWVIRTALAFACAAIAAGPALAQTFEVSPASRKALGISTAAVFNESAIEGESAFGTVIAPPGNSHPVTSPFDAVLLDPLVIPGMQVNAGDPVAILYSPEYETAHAELETQRLTVEHMDHLAERAEELRQLGLRSAQEADEAEHDSKSAHLAFAASQGRLNAVRPAKGAGRFELVAPASGIVADISVNAGDPVAMSDPFLSIFDGKRYWLDVALPERAANSIRIGAPVNLEGATEKGTVIAIDPKVDARLQTIRIKIELPNSTPWRLGQLVDLSLESSSGANALIIPARALVRIGGTDCVFVEEGSSFRRVDVTVLSRSRTEVSVQGTLKTGDQVAVSGLAALKNLAEGA
ncbi:MAG: efflux RND transporter periplasmic adaptor subunit [Hyphomonas sp.]|nr:efflux RND transporter periplasmic adaptor subunit [Hyphomonas sp.]